MASSGFYDAEGPEDRLSYVEVKVPREQPAGIIHVEVARGSLLSHSKVLPNAWLPLQQQQMCP